MPTFMIHNDHKPIPVQGLNNGILDYIAPVEKETFHPIAQQCPYNSLVFIRVTLWDNSQILQ